MNSADYLNSLEGGFNASNQWKYGTDCVGKEGFHFWGKIDAIGIIMNRIMVINFLLSIVFTILVIIGIVKVTTGSESFKQKFRK